MPDLLTPGPGLSVLFTLSFYMEVFLSSCGCAGVNGDRGPGLLEQESVDFEWSLLVKGVPEMHGV